MQRNTIAKISSKRRREPAITHAQPNNIAAAAAAVESHHPQPTKVTSQKGQTSIPGDRVAIRGAIVGLRNRAEATG